MSLSLIEPVSTEVIALVQPIIEGLGFEIVEMNLLGHGKRRTFQVLVDKTGGISIDDCASISRNLSRLLDVEDPFPFEYTLEVGSPGIFRELKTDEDLKRYNHNRVKVKLHEPYLESHIFVGNLTGYKAESVFIQDEAGSGEMEIPRSNIKRLHLEPKL